MRAVIPFRKRPIDIVIVAFFILNLLFITYIVDFEQIAIPGPVDPAAKNFVYPVWPPAPLVDLVDRWAKSNDPARLWREHPFTVEAAAGAQGNAKTG